MSKTEEVDQALALKQRLYDKFGYDDGRVKRLASMHTWEFGPPPGTNRHHTTCWVLLRVEDDGSALVMVTGDAPVDDVVEKVVTDLRGRVIQSRGFIRGLNRIEVPQRAPFGGILRLAEAMDGVPGRRTPAEPNRHYFYEAPRAAEYLRRAYAALTE